MASFDMSIPPRTHCSAARSCGGVRSKSPSREAISVTLTALPPPADQLTPVARTRSQLSCSRWLRQSCADTPGASNRGVHNPVEILCRHADCAVRKLRIQVGIMLNDYRPLALLPALMPSTACAWKNFQRLRHPHSRQSLSTMQYAT